MNDINEIKPVADVKKRNVWDRIKNTMAVAGALAIMTTVSCNSKSEIEWTGDKDSLQNDELVEEGDELLSDEESDDELLTDEEEVDDELLVDEEVDDELLVDEDLVDEDTIEVEDELLTEEEQDLDIVPDEDMVVEIPETIVTLELNVNENVIRATAGELIQINGMIFEVKYDNNDGSIYLMNNEELVRIEWDQTNIANGAEVSVRDIWVNKTAFDTRILYKVTDVNTEKVWHTISDDKGISVAVILENGNFDYVFLETLQNEDWDSGSRTIVSFEANVGGVETKVNDFMVMENEGKQVGNYYIEPTYSVDLYNGKNVIVEYIVDFEESNTTYTMYAKEDETMVINELDKNITIEVDKVFYDEYNMKGWGNFFVGSDLIKTLEQDVKVQYDGFTIELKNVTFTTE